MPTTHHTGGPNKIWIDIFWSKIYKTPKKFVKIRQIEVQTNFHEFYDFLQSKTCWDTLYYAGMHFTLKNLKKIWELV